MFYYLFLKWRWTIRGVMLYSRLVLDLHKVVAYYYVGRVMSQHISSYLIWDRSLIVLVVSHVQTCVSINSTSTIITLTLIEFNHQKIRLPWLSGYYLFQELHEQQRRDGTVDNVSNSVQDFLGRHEKGSIFNKWPTIIKLFM